ACAIALPLTSISSTAEHTVIRINIDLLNRQSPVVNHQSSIARSPHQIAQSSIATQSPITQSPITQSSIAQPYPPHHHILIFLSFRAEADRHRAVAEPQVINAAVDVPRAEVCGNNGDRNGDET